MFNIAEYRKKPDRLSDYLPWAGFIGPGILINKDGAFQRSIRFRGPDLDSSTREELISVRARLNNALRRLGSNWCLHFEASRRSSVAYPSSSFPDPVSAMIDRQRKETFESESRHFETDYYLTFAFMPPTDNAGRLEAMLIENAPTSSETNYRDYYDHFVSTTDGLVGLFSTFMPEVVPLDGSDTLTYLHSCISDRRVKVAMPTVPFYLDELLTDTDFVGGLAPRLGDKHLATISIRGYVSRTLPGLLDELNKLPLEYRWVCRYIPLDKAEAAAHIKTLRRKWFGKRKGLWTLVREMLVGEESRLEDTAAVEKSADADMALLELEEDLVSYGYFTPTVTVWDRDQTNLARKVQRVQKVIDDLGFVTKVENLNAVEAWLGSLPGQAYADVRRPLVSTLNLCDLLPVNAIWAGPTWNEHLKGPPLLVTRTRGSTPFRLSLHQNDVGHTKLIGPPGSGKSTLLALLTAQSGRYPDQQVYIFDKGKSARAITLAVGGDFFDLGAGGDLAFQPLADIDNDAERSWAQEWLLDMLRREGVESTPALKTELWSTLTNLASMPVEQRTMTLLATLIQDASARDALQSYTLNGPHGHLLDADHSNLGYGRWQTFEMEQLMETKAALIPVLTYLFHRLEKRFTEGRPTLLVLDEAWVFLADSLFGAKIREWLRTLRRRNVTVIFATQTLEDIASSDLAAALIESCPTRIFLANSRAREPLIEGIYRKFGLNDKQISLISTATPAREYYYQSRSGNRVFELALSKAELAFCASNSAEEQKVIDSVLREHGREGFAAAWLRKKGLHEEAYQLAGPEMACAAE